MPFFFKELKIRDQQDYVLRVPRFTDTVKLVYLDADEYEFTNGVGCARRLW